MNITVLPELWSLGVLIKTEDGNHSVGVFPVIGLACDIPEAGPSLIEPIVAMQGGRVCCARDLEWEVLFLAKPGEDMVRLATLALHARDLTDVDCMSLVEDGN